ncbi:MAG: hypothetical protein JJU31_02240 [Wenzhouxiangella sp.]|nr:hypothetical protein [Wenzhouxiangella sp.]
MYPELAKLISGCWRWLISGWGALAICFGKLYAVLGDKIMSRTLNRFVLAVSSSDPTRKGRARFLLTLLLFAALAAGTTASSAEQRGEDATGAFDRGNHVFLFEDFPSVENAWGSLQVNSVARLDGHEARQTTMLRATFSSTTSKQLELLASAAEEGDVFLVASTERSEWTMRWNEGRQPVLYGLLEPRDRSHIESIVSHGINVEDLSRYFKPAIHPDDFDVIIDFLGFQSELPYSHPEFSVGEDLELLTEMEWQRQCQLSLDHLPDAEGREQVENIVMSSSLACFSSALSAAGAAVSLWQSSTACTTCLLTRSVTPCNLCAAQLGIASATLMVAIVTCFEDDESPPENPPPPPPPPPGFTPPPPVPAPGGGVLVPIYELRTTTVCVDGTCWSETQLVVVGWQLIMP